MPVVNVDLDGVVDDFHSAMDRIMEPRMVYNPHTKDRKTYRTNSNSPVWEVWEHLDIPKGQWLDDFRRGVQHGEIWATDPVVEGAREGLWFLSDAGFDIRIVTTRLVHKFGHKVTIQKTAEWLENNSIPYRTICFLGPNETKTDFTSHYAIDDNPDNLNPNIPGSFIFSRPWNLGRDDNHITRVSDWSDFTGRVIQLEEQRMASRR